MLIDVKFISDMIEIRPNYSLTSHLITLKENKKQVKDPINT
jgi:hypothetical protein